MQGALAAASGKEVVLEGRQGRKLFFEQLEVKVDILSFPCPFRNPCTLLHKLYFLAALPRLLATSP